MVVCQSDIYPGNFILDDHDGHITMIDFEIVNILPLSFSICSLRANHFGIDFRGFGIDFLERLQNPVQEMIEKNSSALLVIRGLVVQCSSSFSSIGESLLKEGSQI